MSAIKTDTLVVPGAKLYYEVRGSGPILVLIAAGSGDADSYNGIASTLMSNYTVVTFDRRGYSRSPVDDPAQPIDIKAHADDVSHLLAALTTEPAYVFGCSIGAIVGLDLVNHHADQVSVLVAHEPPAGQLLKTGLRADQNLVEMYKKQGAAEAITKFTQSIGITHNGPNLNIGLPQKDSETAAYNREAFFKHDAPAVAQYWLDVAHLKTVPTKIVIGGGTEGREYFPYLCAVALADQLGTPVAEFPGKHAGFVDYPQEFAARLDDILSH